MLCKRPVCGCNGEHPFFLLVGLLFVSVRCWKPPRVTKPTNRACQAYGRPAFRSGRAELLQHRGTVSLIGGVEAMGHLVMQHLEVLQALDTPISDRWCRCPRWDKGFSTHRAKEVSEKETFERFQRDIHRFHGAILGACRMPVKSKTSCRLPRIAQAGSSVRTSAIRILDQQSRCRY